MVAVPREVAAFHPAANGVHETYRDHVPVAVAANGVEELDGREAEVVQVLMGPGGPCPCPE
eukprot:877362-Lingulodinium_polyedra.AAC.1